MQLQFAGTAEVAADADLVWRRLGDIEFVARSAPGVTEVTPEGPGRYRVIAGIGIGFVSVHLTLLVEILEMAPPSHATMRVHGTGPGTELDTRSTIRVEPLGPGRQRLAWEARSEVHGALAGVGARLLEAAVRRLTEQFWDNFAKRVKDASS